MVIKHIFCLKVEKKTFRGMESSLKMVVDFGPLTKLIYDIDFCQISDREYQVFQPFPKI